MITIQATDATGNPVPGAAVDLSSSSGTGTFYDSTGANAITSAYTDANGDASFLYEDTAAGAPTLTATVEPNLVTNGGFETGDFTGWAQGGNTGSTYVDSSPSDAHSGSDSAALGPIGSLGFLTQNVQTVVGQQYTFSWWLGNDQDNSPSEFQASWNGSVIFDQTSIPAQGYTSYSFTELMATSTSTPIQFGFRQDPAFFHLDDVTVVPIRRDRQCRNPDAARDGHRRRRRLHRLCVPRRRERDRRAGVRPDHRAGDRRQRQPRLRRTGGPGQQFRDRDLLRHVRRRPDLHASGDHRRQRPSLLLLRGHRRRRADPDGLRRRQLRRVHDADRDGQPRRRRLHLHHHRSANAHLRAAVRPDHPPGDRRQRKPRPQREDRPEQQFRDRDLLRQHRRHGHHQRDH